eukprot:Nk52_evm14s559 gene=Nk52_evmTU14s559
MDRSVARIAIDEARKHAMRAEDSVCKVIRTLQLSHSDARAEAEGWLRRTQDVMGLLISELRNEYAYVCGRLEEEQRLRKHLRDELKFESQLEQLCMLREREELISGELEGGNEESTIPCRNGSMDGERDLSNESNGKGLREGINELLRVVGKYQREDEDFIKAKKRRLESKIQTLGVSICLENKGNDEMAICDMLELWYWEAKLLEQDNREIVGAHKESQMKCVSQLPLKIYHVQFKRHTEDLQTDSAIAKQNTMCTMNIFDYTTEYRSFIDTGRENPKGKRVRECSLNFTAYLPSSGYDVQVQLRRVAGSGAQEGEMVQAWTSVYVEGVDELFREHLMAGLERIRHCSVGSDDISNTSLCGFLRGLEDASAVNG